MNNYLKIMKDTEVIYLNEQHEKIVGKHINTIKKLMYFATENTEKGKFQDFLTILKSIYVYSNNFHETMVSKKKKDDGVIAEFLFLIPNMSFYTAIGFLTALKDGKNDLELRDVLERIGVNCENATSELADILIDEEVEKEMIKDIFGIEINKN